MQIGRAYYLIQRVSLTKWRQWTQIGMHNAI